MFGSKNSEKMTTSLLFNLMDIMAANPRAFVHIAVRKNLLVNLALGKWVPGKFAINLGVRIADNRKAGVRMPNPCHVIATKDGAVDAVGLGRAEQDEIIAEIQKATAGV